jgi:dipeptidyl aminopeptidase/acylaminoacyl peptidase
MRRNHLTGGAVIFLVWGAAVGVVRADPGDAPSAEIKLRSTEQMKHGDGIRSTVFSRDGQLLLTASEDHTARLWETATGKPAGGPFTHADIIKEAAISPDGKVVATASKDNTVRLWDVKTGQPIGRSLRHQRPVNAVAFSPDGKYVATASDDFTARLWVAATCDRFGPVLRHPHQVNHVAFLPDGRTLVTTCWDMTVRKWDVATGKELGTFLSENFGVNSLGVGRDGRALLTGSREHGGRLWEVASGKPLCEPFARDHYFSDVALSPDSRAFLVASKERKAGDTFGPPAVQLWDAVTLQPVGKPLPDQNAPAFHPGGKIIATGGEDGVIHLWDLSFRPGRPKVVKVDSLDPLWDDLAGEDAARAYRAAATLAAVPDKAVPFLGQRLKSAKPLDAKRLHKLIADLDDELFETRENAEKELAATGKSAEPVLRAELEKRPPLEVEMRLKRILEAGGTGALTADQLRILRCVRVLEDIGSDEARRVLRELAKISSGTDLAREAESALERLAARP